MDKDKIIADLIKRLDHLENEISELRTRLSQYENPKNSRNSSIPPSKDENRPLQTRSLRKVSGKKVGGQKGHQGNTLEMTETPDEIITLIPDYCNRCGASLQIQECQDIEMRQVIDIPPIKAIYTQYQSFSKQCSCGCTTRATFPAGVHSPVCYGSSVESVIAYYHARQYLPFARMKEMFTDIFGLPISEGGIHYLLNRFANKTKPVYEIIRKQVTTSSLVGTDETGARINGLLSWFWTWQTPKVTFIAASNNRGFETIEYNFKEGFPQSALTHDCWKPQLLTNAKTHQICLAHLLRELEYITDLYKQQWSIDFKTLLLDAIVLKRTMTTHDYSPYNENVEKILLRFDTLLMPNEWNKEKQKLKAFHKRMLRLKDYVFPFLLYPEIPPDNNASERAIRNIKVKQKISGQFKTIVAAQNFAMIRSVIDTITKNNQNVLEGLYTIANFEFQFD
jgi:transposase